LEAVWISVQDYHSFVHLLITAQPTILPERQKPQQIHSGRLYCLVSKYSCHEKLLT